MRTCLALGLGLVLLQSAAPTRADDALTPKTLRERLAAKPTGDEAVKLADAIRAMFGKNNLERGAQPKVSGLEAAWAVEAPKPTGPPRVVSSDDSFTLPLVRVGDTDIYAGVAALPEGTAMRWHYESIFKDERTPAEKVSKTSGYRPPTSGQLEAYAPHPDSAPRTDVPKGTLTQQEKWKSKIFEGTSRDWWVYVPSQYKEDSPACVMVFQDGAGYKDFVATTFDNLIAKGDMPVTVGVFINPGTFEGGRSNRSFEYDTLSDQYARFLLEEILPEVGKKTKLRHDAASRAIAGISSGGICAWTVAWERPNEFSKVLSWVGSFTNIAHGKTGREGGHNYEAMIRKSPNKPIRVFLQDGENDLDNANGNWPLANQQMAKSLKFMHYDYQFVYGKGFHSMSHGKAIFPDSLRWLWRDYKPSP